MSADALVVGAAIVRGDQLLVAQRAYPAALAGKWELPGGKVERNETPQAALTRECREELGIDVQVLGQVREDLEIPGGRWLRVFAARTDGEPQAHEHARLLWAAAGELASIDWLPADRPLLPALIELLRSAG